MTNRVTTGSTSHTCRHTSMAESTLSLGLDGAPTVLRDEAVRGWEHNTHVGYARATDMAAAGMVNLGQLARERHGRGNVVIVGFGGYRGGVVAAERWGARMQRMPVPPAREESVEVLLHTVSAPMRCSSSPTASGPAGCGVGSLIGRSGWCTPRPGSGAGTTCRPCSVTGTTRSWTSRAPGRSGRCTSSRSRPVRWRPGRGGSEVTALADLLSGWRRPGLEAGGSVRRRPG